MRMKITFLLTALVFLCTCTKSNSQTVTSSELEISREKMIQSYFQEIKLDSLHFSSLNRSNGLPPNTELDSQDAGNFWKLNGNSGTSVDTHFIGTSDNEDFKFKRNNVNSGRIGFTNTSYGLNSGQGGLSNINIGRGAGNNSTDMLNFFNISIGDNSGKSNVSGFVNTFVGSSAGFGNTSGYGNTFIGAEAGKLNSDGFSNTALGYRALYNNREGNYNIALSPQSLESNFDGNNNIALGTRALQKNTDGNSNIGIGVSSGQLSTGNNNIFMGMAAGKTLKTGDKNLYIGYFTGHFLENGSNNIFIGANSGYSTSLGSNNLFLGNNSGVNSGSKNIAIGEDAGGNTGNGNILLGNNSLISPGFQSNPLTNNILNIGNVIFGYNMNRISSTDNTTTKQGMIGINTTIPKNTLEIKSEAKDFSGLRLTNLTSSFNPTSSPTTNKFLSVDANGDVVLQYMSNSTTTNALTSDGNLMTSNVNTVSSVAPIVNSISNSINNENQLVTTVNGVASSPVTLPIPNFSEIDGSTTNELQTLSQNGNIITLSNNGGSFTLPTFTDTDAQSLTLTGNNLSILNGNTVTLPTTHVIAGNNVTVTGSGTATNPFQIATQLQTLSQTGNIVSLSNNGGFFTLPTFTDTDAQSLTLTGNNLSILNGNTVTLPTTHVIAGNNVTVSGSGTATNPFQIASQDDDEQTLTLTGNNLSISNGNSVVLPTFTEVDGSTTNELQTLTQNGNVITLSNNGGSFTLPTFTDTDAQSLTLTGNNLSILNGNTVTLPTTHVIAGNNVTVTGSGTATNPFQIASQDDDGQTLTLTGNNLSILNGNSVTLPTTHVIAGNNVTVTGSGTSTNPFQIATQTQTLTQSGNIVSLSNNGGSFTLPTFTDTDTDAQSLSLVGNNLTISNGNTVALPTTNVIAGNNITVTGNGSTATPFQIASVDTSLYANNGTINQSTTTNNNRVVNMNNRNIWFNTSTSTTNGKIYLGSTTSFPNTTGNYKLFVEGGILTEKVKVALRSTANWADYVFDENYKLMPLSDVEKFITANKHLPGVDSASDLAKDGLDVAEMQAKQMEKIEELTLYAIQQDKIVQQQSLAIEQQNKEIEELKLVVKSLIEKTK
jgi:trimeric autotransporter adhesin